MIKNISLCILLLFLPATVLLAQNNENDTIPPTKPKVILPDTIRAEKDTIPVRKTPRIIPSDSSRQTNEPKIYQYDPDAEEKKEPRIIRYESSGNGHVKTKIKNRGRHRNGYREIHTLTGRNRYNGGFGALSFRSTELRDETIIMAGVRAGWIINRALGIGFEAHGIVPTASFTDINPVDLKPVGGYGGMFLEPVFFSNQVIHVTFPVSAGAGWLGYYTDDNTTFSVDGAQVSEDVFWYVEPGASLEINIARNFRLAGGVSKRFVDDLSMLETSDGDFETLSYFVTLKIGSF